MAGWAETELKDYDLVFYNGNLGTVYKTVPLSGAIDNEQCGFGAVWFPVNAIENGPNDGIALVKDTLTVKQFLSYEGVLTALDGPASGMTSTNIRVSEPSSSPADYSVQLVGTGTTYSAFTWRSPTNASPGDLNVGQEVECFSIQSHTNAGPALTTPTLEDLDGDGVPNRDEIFAGTDPTNHLSFLYITNQVFSNSATIIFWPSVTNRNYTVERGSAVGGIANNLIYTNLVTGIAGTGGGLSWTDAVASVTNPSFYRIQVRQTDTNTNGLPD
jgi:hypothetical protein